MPKNSMFPLHAPVAETQLADMKKRAISLVGVGAIFDAQTGCFYLEAKHPLSIEATVIRIPGSSVVGLCAALFATAVGPMLATAEAQLAKAARKD